MYNKPFFVIGMIVFIIWGFFCITVEGYSATVGYTVAQNTQSTNNIKGYLDSITSSMKGKEYSFADTVNAVDIMLTIFLTTADIPEDALVFIDVEKKKKSHTWYTFQEIAIKIPKNTHFDMAIKEIVHFSPYITIDKKNASIYDIYIEGLLTHRVHIEKVEETQLPKVVIVIDDVGESLFALQKLVELNIPLTYAVWPFATLTRKSVEYLHKNKNDILIHFPMEPLGYPNVKPGKGVITVDMDTKALHKTIDSVVKTIPEAIGINNHMGSRFTAHKQSVQALTEYFIQQKPKWILLDSLTNPKSLLYGTAQKTGLEAFRRSIFLDHTRTVEATLKQLSRMEILAKKYGTIIAIGHPAPTTIKALEEWVKTRDSAIQIVRISDI